MRKFSLKPINIIFLTIAGIINAFGVTLFLAPVNLFDSGISGTAFLLDLVTPPYLVMSMFLIILNVPFYILGWKKLGSTFVIYSLYSIGMYSLFSLLFRNILPIDFSNGSPFTGSDLILSAIFGGLISGIGSGLVMRFGGAIDGVDVMAVLFAKKLGLSAGSFIMIYNVILYIVAALIFGSWQIPLYSIIAYAVGVKTIDFIVEGFDRAKAVYIVSAPDNDLPKQLSEVLGRGVTILDAHGVYSDESKTFIYCVINRFEINLVKKTVDSIDPSAFISISEIADTVGSRRLRLDLSGRKKTTIPTPKDNANE